MTLEHKLRVICAGLSGRTRTDRMVELRSRPDLIPQHLAIAFKRLKGQQWASVVKDES